MSFKPMHPAFINFKSQWFRSCAAAPAAPWGRSCETGRPIFAGSAASNAPSTDGQCGGSTASSGTTSPGLKEVPLPADTV